LEKKIHKIKEEFISKLKIANNIKDIEKLRIEYLGRKGALTLLLRMLGTLSSEERPKIGQLLNQTKREIEEFLKTRIKEIEGTERDKRLQEEIIDITLPGRSWERGNLHPLTLVLKEIEEIFSV